MSEPHTDPARELRDAIARTIAIAENGQQYWDEHLTDVDRANETAECFDVADALLASEQFTTRLRAEGLRLTKHAADELADVEPRERYKRVEVSEERSCEEAFMEWDASRNFPDLGVRDVFDAGFAAGWGARTPTLPAGADWYHRVGLGRPIAAAGDRPPAEREES